MTEKQHRKATDRMNRDQIRINSECINIVLTRGRDECDRTQ